MNRIRFRITASRLCYRKRARLTGCRPRQGPGHTSTAPERALAAIPRIGNNAQHPAGHSYSMKPRGVGKVPVSGADSEGQNQEAGGSKKSGTARTRTENQGIMLATSAFAAPFGFVVWTIPSLYVSAVWSLHLLPDIVVKTTPAAWLGISMSARNESARNEAFPEFGRFYSTPRRRASPQRNIEQPVGDNRATSRSGKTLFRRSPLKSPALPIELRSLVCHFTGADSLCLSPLFRKLQWTQQVRRLSLRPKHRASTVQWSEAGDRMVPVRAMVQRRD